MIEKPYISIVIPTYNRENLILRAIQSVQNQTYENWELIVVDDGSTDNTEQAIKGLDDKKIRYIKNEENIGAAASRNRGAALAQYDYLAFQDSDDVWRRDKLEKQMTYLLQHPQFDMVYSSFVNHHLDGTEVLVPNQQVGEREGDLFFTLLVNNVIGAPTILLKRDNFLEKKGFDKNLSALEDWDFVLRFSETSQIGFLPEVLVDAYQTKGSVSWDGAGYFEAKCKMLASHYREAQEVQLFDELVKSLFQDAERRGVLPPVQRIFMKYLEFYMK